MTKKINTMPPGILRSAQDDEKVFRLETYNYELPPELISAHPVSPRDAARLLVWPTSGSEKTSRTKKGEDKIFSDLADYLDAGDVLVVNSSKVVPARLFGTRPKREGTRQDNAKDVPVEFLLHQPKGDFSTWTAFAKPAKRLKPADSVRFENGVTAEILGREADQILLRFNLAPDAVESFLEACGHVPLPPYIRRGDEVTDKSEYQTVYAEQSGSVAAPTAGLHFTEGLLQKIKAKGVQVVDVTLHVGAGTFLSVTEEDIRRHRMHAEWGRVTADAAVRINAAKKAGAKIIAVGTTATRLLETAARQEGNGTGMLAAWEGSTDIFITPGFAFKIVDRLVTNFHLPKSTLLMLVSAFLGNVEEAQALYREAIARKYRFYSYGDACMLTRAVDA